MTSLDKNDDGTLDGAGEAEYESLDTDVLNSADLDNAASGEVPQAQGDGTLSMGSVSGGPQIERGQVGHQNANAAADGTWDTSNNDITSESFSSAFSTTPIIAGTQATPNTGLVFENNNKSATGFDNVMRGYLSTENRSSAYDYIAVEP